MTPDTITRFSTATASVRDTRTVSELRRLWLAAAEADEAFGGGLDTVSTEEFNRLELAQFEARHELLDYLLMEFGLTSADIKRGVL